MKIQPIVHKTLAEAVAGKLSASLLDGSLQPGTQLPPERELSPGLASAVLRYARHSRPWRKTGWWSRGKM